MIISLYTSMLPVIIGGVFNMLFVKIKALSFKGSGRWRQEFKRQKNFW